VFGHKWEQARGTIVGSRIEQTTVDGTPGLQQVRVYDVDIRKPSGEALRATVQSPYDLSTELSPGVTIRLEVNAKTAEVRFDPSQPAPTAHAAASVREAARLAKELRGHGADGGAIVAALASMGQTTSSGQPGDAGMPPGVLVVGGPQMAEFGAKAAELVQTMMAGGGDQASTIEKIRQLKANIQAQAGNVQAQAAGLQGQAGIEGQAGMEGQDGRTGSVGFSSPEAPSTFDSVNQAMPAATFSSPADAFGTPTSSVGPPGGSVSFSSPPVAPASFEPVTPAKSGSPAGGSSFGAGGSYSPFGLDSKADRIALLEDQRDRGQLTEQQFATQRQQIMDEF
jgi:hypothetical protein